jgi:hypothetical protein
MDLSIPTTDEIRVAVRDELAAFFAVYNPAPTSDADEIGKGAEYASKITGKAVPTIYDLVHRREIPHSKRGKDLYFSKNELLDWIRSGRRRTREELASAVSA